MPHNIELSDATFERLKKLAEPLVDTTETVIVKLLDTQEAGGSTRANGVGKPAQSAHPQARDFSAASPPSLTHTKVLVLKLNGAPLRDLTWNGLLAEAIKLAKAEVRTQDELGRLVTVPFVTGRKETEGFHFIEGIGLSVQGQDANAAWRASYHIARQLGIAIEAEFVWRAKDGAVFPGLTGRLSA
ncbi:MAG TPA: hypothetical protein VEC38_09400 [Candidatus Binataceae bacterium]|nr:hypothetical protein [Candidatus Binataceae bacterium]